MIEEVNTPNISMIACVDSKGGIGFKNDLPWPRFKEDMKFFVSKTNNNIVIMGYKTFESLKFKPLPNRINIVVNTHDVIGEQIIAKGWDLYWANSTESAIKLAEKIREKLLADAPKKEIILIGGASIYKSGMDLVDTVYLTQIDKEFEADTFFPIDKLQGLKIESEESGENEMFQYRFVTIIMDNNKRLVADEVPVEKIMVESRYTLCEGYWQTPCSHTTWEVEYAQILRDILTDGVLSTDRTGTGTLRQQHAYLKIDLQKTYPALRGKKVVPKHALVEMLWIMQGLTNTEFLKKNGVNYWAEWADENGDLGPIYGKQMRDNNGIDQLQNCVDLIRNCSDSRRIIIDLWNPSELSLMKLPPCHITYQFCVYIVDGVKTLDLHVTQRSGDMFVGVGYDLMLFSNINHIMAFMCNIKVGYLHLTINDAHIYQNHIAQVKEYINTVFTDTRNIILEQSKLEIDLGSKLDLPIKFDHIDDLLKLFVDNNFEDFKLTNYDSYRYIPAKVAI